MLEYKEPNKSDKSVNELTEIFNSTNLDVGLDDINIIEPDKSIKEEEIKLRKREALLESIVRAYEKREMIKQKINKKLQNVVKELEKTVEYKIKRNIIDKLKRVQPLPQGVKKRFY